MMKTKVVLTDADVSLILEAAKAHAHQHKWAVTIAVDLVAAQLVMAYWFPGVNGLLWSAIFLALMFGLMAPTFTGLMLAAPKEFIMVLGGLAMLRELQGAFVASFGAGKFSLGALVSLLVTVADIGLFNIGAAFWGLVAGFAVSWWMERGDFRKA
jgi:hypothetical protein